MSAIFVSIDGCKDTIAKQSVDFRSCSVSPLSTTPAIVILPENSFDPCIVGKEAHESRICRGYDWPAESRFTPEKGVRRLPVTLAWKLLLAARDRKTSWKTTETIYYPLSNVIADYILSTSIPKDTEIVLSVPNNLHEFGQQSIINSFRGRGYKVTLLWRPIAAALTWCDKLPARELRQIENKDNLLIIHLGVDAFEFVSLGLRKESFNGNSYVVPVRRRPTVTINISGIDIIANAAEQLIEKTWGGSHRDAIWQAFTVFPDLWEIALGRKKTDVDLKLIQVNSNWEIWKTDNIINSLKDFSVQSKWLEELICSETNLANSIHSENSVIEYIKKSIREILRVTEGEIVGAVITGGFENLPFADGSKLKDIIFEELNSAGLDIDNLSSPAAGYIFYSNAPMVDFISEGCFVYKKRLENGMVPYFDTLPKLEIYARIAQSREWCSLVESGVGVVKGGETYKNKIEDKFGVERGTSHVDFYLRREDSDDIKKLPLDLPDPAPNLIKLNLDVQMQPVQGFALVEVIPDDTKFFGSERLYLDWSRMESAPLPGETQVGYGFPEIFSVQTHSQVYSTLRYFIKDYLRTNASEINYENILTNLRDKVNKPTNVLIGNNFKQYRLVDENGELPFKTNETIFDDLLKKIEVEFKQLKSGGRYFFSKRLSLLLQTATWLYAAATKSCYEYMRIVLQEYGTDTPQVVVHAIGRSFKEEKDIELFFKIAVKRLRREQGANNWVGAISRILQHRENAPKCLERGHALFLAQFALKKLTSEFDRDNIKLAFKNAAHLFLYLLRWRIVDSSFLVNGEEYELGQRVKEILDQATRATRDHRVRDILEQIAKYIEYKGDTLIIGFPDVSVDED